MRDKPQRPQRPEQPKHLDCRDVHRLQVHVNQRRNHDEKIQHIPRLCQVRSLVQAKTHRNYLHQRFHREDYIEHDVDVRRNRRQILVQAVLRILVQVSVEHQFQAAQDYRKQDEIIEVRVHVQFVKPDSHNVLLPK